MSDSDTGPGDDRGTGPAGEGAGVRRALARLAGDGGTVGPAARAVHDLDAAAAFVRYRRAAAGDHFRPDHDTDIRGGTEPPDG